MNTMIQAAQIYAAYFFEVFADAFYRLSIRVQEASPQCLHTSHPTIVRGRSSDSNIQFACSVG